MSPISDSQFRPPMVSYTSKTTLRENSLAKPSSSKKSLLQAIFDVEAIQDRLVDDVEDTLESSDNREDIEVALSDEPQRPRASSARRRELLKDNMEMLSKALSMLDTKDFSNSSDEEGDFHDDSVDSYGF
jgi:hypothetical protein